MAEIILMGRGRQVTHVPRIEWEEHLSYVPHHQETRLRFMTAEHHQVRYFVVRELPRLGVPIPPEVIANALQLPLARVHTILDELEQHLFFLVRNAQGAVSWAFPVTVDTTPYRLTFSTGEQVFAAGAEDAMATPFVQGRLWQVPLFVDLQTICAHCAWPIHFRLDSALQFQVYTAGAEPLVFEPQINWASFAAPNIIQAYGHHSVFFWSEEHARAFRAEAERPDGVLLTLEQSVYSTRIVQGGLFAFT